MNYIKKLAYKKYVSIIENIGGFFLIVQVKDNQVEYANRILKKRMQKAGIYEYAQSHKHHITKTQKKMEKASNKIKVIHKYLKNRKKKEGY